jgi:hypothetical protein
MNDTAQSRWRSLELYRSQYLRRGIDCSGLTIPTLIPESDQNYGNGQQFNKLPSLYQGAGARGVSSLSAKLLLALYPPSQPFFRLVMDKGQMEQYIQTSGADPNQLMTELDIALSSMERQILQRMDQLQARAALFEAIKHLIVGGNALLYIGDESIRMYGLRSFCVDRDPEGNVTEIVIRENVSHRHLPPGAEVEGDEDSDDRDIEDLYTHVTIDPRAETNQVEWFQEYDGKRIPGTSGFSKLESSPWIPLRLHRVAGESYGRSLVEEVLGDLQSLESLSKAIVEGSLIAAKAIGLVNPNGTTRADVLARAENGAIVAGNAADVEFLQVQKTNDFATALQTMQLIERRLNFTFLTNEAVQRDAERVTAEEIRLMAEQLEQGLGGVYSILSNELQLPLIRRVMHMMERGGEMPAVPKGLIEPQVTTGLEAIGRGNDKQRLTNFLQVVAASIGPEQFLQFINPSELIRRYAASDGIDINGLVKSEQELQAANAQQQQVQLAQQLTQGAVANGLTTPPQPGAGPATAAGGQQSAGAAPAAGPV